MKKFFYLSTIFFFLFCTFILSLMYSYSKTMFRNISNNLLRLHIVANSDSTEDQIMKYKIRDEVLNYLKPYLSSVKDKETAIQIINKHMPELKILTSDIAKKNNYNYPINISISSSYFPAKSYGNITLPEGSYDALKIDVGNSSGQNWWCVMYPCLCSVDSSSHNLSYNTDETLLSSLGSEEISLITDSNHSKPLKFKFKLIELFENL